MVPPWAASLGGGGRPMASPHPPPGAEERNLPCASTSGRAPPPTAASLATAGRRMRAGGRLTVRPRTSLSAIHEPGTAGTPAAEEGDGEGGSQPSPSTLPTEPPASIAFLMRAVLDADTIPDLTKRRLLTMGAARGLDFDRLVGVSMWDEASGVVSRADGQWPSVEGFEASVGGGEGTSLTSYTPALADDWRAGALPPTLATALDAVATEVVAVVDAVRIEVQPADPDSGARVEDGERGEEAPASALSPPATTDVDPEEAVIAALEERVRGAAAASASAAAAGSAPAKKGFGGFGGGKAKAGGRKGASSKRASASSSAYPTSVYSYSTIGQSLTPDAFIIAGPDLEDTVDALMAPVEGADGSTPSTSNPFRSSCDAKAARSLAAAAAALLGVLTDADMESHLEDPYGGGNFREEVESGGKVVDSSFDDAPAVEAASSSTTPVPSREHLDPGVAKGFAAAIRAAHKAKAKREEEEEKERERAAAEEAAAAAAAPVLPSAPAEDDALLTTSAAEAERAAVAAVAAGLPGAVALSSSDDAAATAAERVEIVAAMAALGVTPAPGSAAAVAAAAEDADLAAVAAEVFSSADESEEDGEDEADGADPGAALNAAARRRARRAGKTAAWLAAQAVAGKLAPESAVAALEADVKGAGGNNTQSRPVPVGDAAGAGRVVVVGETSPSSNPAVPALDLAAGEVAARAAPSSPPPAHAYASRDKTGARMAIPGRLREVRQVPWAQAIGYVAPGLRPHERATWKAAGVLIYTFDPYGELMLLLGRTFMYAGAGADDSDGGPPNLPDAARPQLPPVPAGYGEPSVALGPAYPSSSPPDPSTPRTATLRAWNLLGGKRKRRDATAEATAIRELVEETGGLVTPDMLRGPLTPVLWYPPGSYAAFPYCLPPGEAAYALPDRFAQRRAVGRASVPASGHDTACLDWVRLRSILSGRRRIHVFMEDMLRRTRLMDWLRTQQEQYWAASPRPLRVRGGAGNGTGRGGVGGVNGGTAPFLPARGRKGGEAEASVVEADAPPPLPPGALHLGVEGSRGAHPVPVLHSADAPEPAVVTPGARAAAIAWPPPGGTVPRKPRGVVPAKALPAAVLAAAAGPVGAGAVFLPAAGAKKKKGAAVTPAAALALGPAAASAYLPHLARPPPRPLAAATGAPDVVPYAVVHMPAASEAGEAAVAAATVAVRRKRGERSEWGSSERRGSSSRELRAEPVDGGDGRAPRAGRPPRGGGARRGPPRRRGGGGGGGGVVKPQEGGDGSQWYGAG